MELDILIAKISFRHDFQIAPEPPFRASTPAEENCQHKTKACTVSAVNGPVGNSGEGYRRQHTSSLNPVTGSIILVIPISSRFPLS